MEIQNNRALGYQLATPIANEDLTEISGGGTISTHGTVSPSGNSIASADVTVDTTIDW